MALNLVEQRVQAARDGCNPYLICRMASGWLVIGDVQPVPGYCLLLADPVCDSVNALADGDRARFCADMMRAGDALIEVTGAQRVNYEIYGNLVPVLHAHITPRFAAEPRWRRTLPAVLAHPKILARRFDPARDGPFIDRMRAVLTGSSAS